MTSTTSLALLLLACADPKDDTGTPSDPTDTGTPTDGTTPDDTATSAWVCGADVPGGVRALGITENYGGLTGQEGWFTRVATSEKEWSGILGELETLAPFPLGSLDAPDFDTETGLVGVIVENWGMVPLGLYEITGDPSGVSQVQATWCTVVLATRLDTFSAAVAAYAIPREWGADVESTLVTWYEEE